MSMISAQIDELRELAGDGSMEWVVGPVRASVLRDAADTIWQLRDDLQLANAENAKLRELVRDMYGFIERTDEECGDVTFSDCFDYCKHDATDDGCCKTGECWYEQRMRELGVEVNE